MKKVCSTCGESKNASQFSWRKDRGRHYNDCKKCRGAKMAASRAGTTIDAAICEAQAIERDPYGHLAADIVVLAIQDLQTEKSDELLAFFASRWFEELCDATNVHPHTVLNNISGLRMAVTRTRLRGV